MLVVDQLEELFTLTAKPEDRAHFDALLAEALADLDAPLHLITTVRSDFMVRFADCRGCKACSIRPPDATCCRR